MSGEFDGQLMYALSCLRRNRTVPPVPMPSRTQKKQLKLLDALALLLVTEGKDVAAVSLLHNRTSVEFYYAKNRPCTPHETAYVQKLLEIAKAINRPDLRDWFSGALDIVVQTCIKKVKGRIQKIINEMRKCGISPSLPLEDIHNLPIWHETDLKGEFPKAYEIVFRAAQSMEQMSDRDALIHYFKGLFRISEEGEIEDIRAAVWLSHYIGHALHTAPILGNSALVRRIQRLGDYVDAIKILGATLLDPAIFGMKDTIKFIEVS
ncbi:MAG: hypothetical protein M1840_001259 [Geoglossum simile]|nr:MAG: hypothetical protein M1840_001259 [Geoglossum simile]